MPSPLSPRQAKFINKLDAGYTKTDAAIVAGYPAESASVTASRLLKNATIIKALEAKGLTDNFIAGKLKRNITQGSKLPVTQDAYMRSIDLVTKLKGYQDTRESNVTQNNVHIELHGMSDEQLLDMRKQLLESTKQE